MSGTKNDMWVICEGLMTYDGKVYLKSSSPLVKEVVLVVHNATHEGIHKTMEHIRNDFCRKGWKATIQSFIQSYMACQRNKWETLQPVDLLQPLPIRETIWSDVSMDFFEALPNVSGKSILLVVVDRSSKYANFLQTGHPYTPKSVAKAFFVEIFRLHGFLETIVSDRDKVF